jgi:hypothetical protein
MSKDLVMSGCASTGDVVSNFFNILVALLQEFGDRLCNLGEV